MLWAMPWEVLCSYEHDPVTTDPKGEAAIPVTSGRYLGLEWQIYGRRNTRALIIDEVKA